MSVADLHRPGVWRALFPQALRLMEHLEAMDPGIVWTFGGGTVLMLRIAHRQSKDIDLFVPDAQYLGFVNPRLSEVASGVSENYEESTEFIKLYLPEGEVDVVASTALTPVPFEEVEYEGRLVKVETSAEILAKKMWHRGHRAKARDLYDLCSVAEREPEALPIAAPWFKEHARAFIDGLREREEIAREEFAQIDAIGLNLEFDRCLAQAEAVFERLGVWGPGAG